MRVWKPKKRIRTATVNVLAGVAQSVEQWFCKPQVVSSILIAGCMSTKKHIPYVDQAGYLVADVPKIVEELRVLEKMIKRRMRLGAALPEAMYCLMGCVTQAEANVRGDIHLKVLRSLPDDALTELGTPKKEAIANVKAVTGYRRNQTKLVSWHRSCK